MGEKKDGEKKDKVKGDKETRKGKRDLEAVQESLHKVWLAGLGAVARAEEEGGKVFKNLVAKGQDYERRGRSQIDRLVSQVEAGAGKAREGAASTYERVESRVDELVSGALHRSGVPSRDEIAILTRRVEELTRMVESLKSGSTPAPAAATAPKTSAATTPPAAPAAPVKPAADKPKMPRRTATKKP